MISFSQRNVIDITVYVTTDPSVKRTLQISTHSLGTLPLLYK